MMKTVKMTTLKDLASRPAPSDYEYDTDAALQFASMVHGLWMRWAQVNRDYAAFSSFSFLGVLDEKQSSADPRWNVPFGSDVQAAYDIFNTLKMATIAGIAAMADDDSVPYPCE